MKLSEKLDQLAKDAWENELYDYSDGLRVAAGYAQELEQFQSQGSSALFGKNRPDWMNE